MKGAIRVLFVGAAAGVAAGQVMDRATTWFYERQSDASRQRENELLPEGAPMASARKLAGLIGAEPTDDQTGQLAAAMHRSLGQLYGVAAAALTRRGVPPVAAGVATGTPPPQAYPVESHLRGLVGHLTFGAATGVLLSVARRLRLL